MSEPLIPPHPSASGAFRARVAIAEDDPAMRQLLATAFRRDAFDVIEAKDGGELLHVLGALQVDRNDGVSVDLIVSDQRMPLLSGLDLLAHVRRARHSLPFILITAFGDDITHAAAHHLGVSAVFDKPFDVAALRRRARELLGVT